MILSAFLGESLASLLQDMSEEEQLHVGEQLRDYLSQLKAIRPPIEAVSGFVGKPLHDDRISMELRPFGPWISTPEFHRFLVEHSGPENPPEGTQ
jgi:hypothetical protein